jgi:hypothetical protein
LRAFTAVLKEYWVSRLNRSWATSSGSADKLSPAERFVLLHAQSIDPKISPSEVRNAVMNPRPLG